MERLTGITQNYAWGSHTLLAALRGDDRSECPEAEIWYGAHAGAPSVMSHSTLLQSIEADAASQLGNDNVSIFGPQLPFLLKLLAADRPLSIQAHPSIEQARIGFDTEVAAGIAPDAPNRCFRDTNHKPELIAAITPFEALVGFRDGTRSAHLLHELGAPASFVDLVCNNGPLAATNWLLDPQSDAHLADIASCLESLVSGAKAYGNGDWAGVAGLLVRLDVIYSGDPGIGVAALLNRIVLQPGEAIYLNAGNLHSYVSGLAVEVMANSDNVVRCGLTPKHIDIETLLTIVRPEAIDPTPVDLDGNRYCSPALEFALTRVDADAELVVSGPAIAVGVKEQLSVVGTETLSLRPTEAAWIPAGESATVATNGLAFVAEVGRSPDA